MGAATALALVTAEVATSLLLGSPLPPRAWAFVALYCVPAFTIAGALGGLLLPLPRVSAALVWAPSAVYCAAVASQDLLSGRPRLAPLRLFAVLVAAAAMAGAAWVTERVLARRPLAVVPSLLARMALLLPVVAALHAVARTLHGAPGSFALALPLAAGVAGVVAAAALAPLLARLSALQATGAAAVVAGAIALAAAAQAARPAPGALRDDPQPAAGAATGPSVVLIVLDTVRASNVSCYGYERRTTPHLDAFAAGALRFTAAATVSPWSVPAHASLFTGLFAPEHGAGTAQRDPLSGLVRPAPLDARFVTLAESLSQRGYATAGISANVLVAPHMNLAQGFRYYDVRPSPRALSPRYRTLLQRLQGLLPRPLLADPLLAAFPGVFRSAEEITDAATGWLARRPAGQPYFLFLNYMDAHTPFVRRPGFSGRWPGRSERLPAYGLPETEAVMAHRRTLTGEEAAHIRALYDDALSYLDHHLGRLLQALDAQPDRDRTWIVVTADHGESLGEHQRLGHDCVALRAGAARAAGDALSARRPGSGAARRRRRTAGADHGPGAGHPGRGRRPRSPRRAQPPRGDGGVRRLLLLARPSPVPWSSRPGTGARRAQVPRRAGPRARALRPPGRPAGGARPRGRASGRRTPPGPRAGTLAGRAGRAAGAGGGHGRRRGPRGSAARARLRAVTVATRRLDAIIEAALAAAVFGLATALVAAGVRVTQEDGFYYLKIAQNLAAGRGSTFDGLHPTNGYQPLWLLCLVPLFALARSAEAALAAATLLQAALFAAATVYLFRLARESGIPPAVSALAGCVWIALTWRTALSGVEFALTAALVAAIALRLRRAATNAPSLRDHAAMGALLALAPLARLDAALLGGLVALGWSMRAGRTAARTAALWLPLAVVCGAYAVVNVALFGHPWPVSGAAKQGWSLYLLAADPVYQSHGWLAAKALQLARPLARPLSAAMPALLVGGLGACAVLAASRWRAPALEPLAEVLRPLRPLVWFAGLQPLAYALAYHGHYSYAPWYYVAQPLLASLMIAAVAQALLRGPRPVVVPALACAVVLAASAVGAARSFRAPEADGPLYVAARWARDHLDASARVGTWNAGAIGFLSGRQVVNLDGVVNTFAYLDHEQYDLCGYWARTGITHLVDVFEAREGSSAMRGATLPVPDFYARCADRLELIWSERPPGNPGWPKAFRIRPAP